MAVNAVFFSRSGPLDPEDLCGILDVKYDGTVAEWLNYQRELISKQPDGSTVGVIPEAIRGDKEFAQKLLFFATGWNHVPYYCQSKYRLTIEFNDNELPDADSLPVAHICVNTLVLPGQAYEGDANKFMQRMAFSLEYTTKMVREETGLNVIPM